MKWDIDKALRFISPKTRPYFRLGNEDVNVNRMASMGLVPTERDKTCGFACLWYLTIGREDEHFKTFWGRSLHDACLRARKYLKKAKSEELVQLGIQLRPRKTGRFLRGNFKSKGVQAGDAS